MKKKCEYATPNIEVLTLFCDTNVAISTSNEGIKLDGISGDPIEIDPVLDALDGLSL